MVPSSITENVRTILNELPQGVQLVAAAKSRTAEEVREAIDAGVGIIGENYVQEAVKALRAIEKPVKWHFIGHLQKNKINKAIKLFDMIETIDSLELAQELDKRCFSSGKVMDVLIEVNSGKEPQKYGIFPEDVLSFAKEIARLGNIRLKGLMTMGPFSGDPEQARPFFTETRKAFEELKEASLPRVEAVYLSMGMTNSYQVAIEEGANLVRIGTKIFGERDVR
ncbi:MAG: YggS family pyridoxal phosphate-dependent enzyme [Candidatus Omnitrophica bacterium]|nr:YggS family pyridoxal phosphate-dependent enzyme [Candidatus Omnitrophota bacterium]